MDGIESQAQIALGSGRFLGSQHCGLCFHPHTLFLDPLANTMNKLGGWRRPSFWELNSHRLTLVKTLLSPVCLHLGDHVAYLLHLGDHVAHHYVIIVSSLFHHVFITSQGFSSFIHCFSARSNVFSWFVRCVVAFFATLLHIFAGICANSWKKWTNDENMMKQMMIARAKLQILRTFWKLRRMLAKTIINDE